MTAKTLFFCLLVWGYFSTAASAGILVSRTDQGLQFTDAVAVTFNTKDKAHTLGGQPKLTGPIQKLPNVT